MLPKLTSGCTVNQQDRARRNDWEDSLMTDRVIAAIVRICGPDHENMLIGERDSLLIAEIERRSGYTVTRNLGGPGFTASRQDRRYKRTYIRMKYFQTIYGLVRHFLVKGMV